MGDPAMPGVPLDCCSPMRHGPLACGDVVCAPRQLGIAGSLAPPFAVAFDGVPALLGASASPARARSCGRPARAEAAGSH